MKNWRQWSLWFVLCLLPIPLLAATAAADSEEQIKIDNVGPTVTATIDWARVPLTGHDEIEPLPEIAPQTPEPFMVEPAPVPVTPAAPPAPEPASGSGGAGPARGQAVYTVQAGDNLFRIARTYGLSVNSLAVANEISDERLIHPGQVLVIPAGGSTSPPPAVATLATLPPEGVYIVQPGDTLERIARRLGLTVQALVNANRLDDPGRLRVGQSLYLSGTPVAAQSTVPAASPAATTAKENEYVVQRGDSLYSIGRRFGVTVQALAGANNIADPTMIHPGLRLIIPERVARATVTPAPAATEPPPTATPAAATATPSPAVIDPGESTFIWPVESRHITQRFRAGHRAIDIITPTGSPVVAAGGGTIEFAGWNVYGYGNLVVIDHANGWRTLYAHNDSLLVKAGQEVARGELISLSGNTGRSNWPHVHLELYQNGRLVDPCGHLPGGC
jgi:murein DD-endopeptidase MepM/ murein hydrolase activator NlpD